MPEHPGHLMRKPPEPQAAVLRVAMSKLLSEQLKHPVFTLEAEVTACLGCHDVRLDYPNGDTATRSIPESTGWDGW